MKVREVIKRIEQDGWLLDRTRGDHRQYVHPVKPGTVTISGHPSADVKPKTLGSILRRSAEERRSLRMKYVVIYETDEAGGYSAYVPDLPGCIAAADTLEECARLIAEAIPFHIDGLKRHGDRVPAPTSVAGSVEVAAA
jgi:predicted RNA binding protein YcfA (HicA-like mRNA interferase family)/predicted RNase H-like HicB family nuclease